MSNQPLTENEFWAIMASIPEPQPVFYRLYYNDQGLPLFYSMEDLPGNYIELTLEQYRLSDSNVRVRQGKLVAVTWTTSECLERTDTGTPCHPDNIAIVVRPEQPHQCWSKRTYEQS